MGMVHPHGGLRRPARRRKLLGRNQPRRPAQELPLFPPICGEENWR